MLIAAALAPARTKKDSQPGAVTIFPAAAVRNSGKQRQISGRLAVFAGAEAPTAKDFRASRSLSADNLMEKQQKQREPPSALSTCASDEH
jgi:hypothetical protein